MAGALRRALALFLVLVTAKLVVLALRIYDGGAGSALLTPAAPVALLAQDALLALLWLGLELVLLQLLRGAAERALWLLYAAAAVYVAANVPVARVLGTPLTYAILSAAGGALADSLRVYVTPGNCAGVALVLGVALLAPRARPRRGVLGVAGVLCALLILLGPAARARVETFALHRNALWALVQTYAAQLSPRATLGAAPPPRVDDLPPLPALPSAMPREPSLAPLAGALRGRSVLWVVLESTAAQYLRPYGAADDPMPTLSALAQRGLLFERAYTAYPESIKGLFAALCSAHPAAHAPAARYTQAALPCVSLAQRLAEAGYRTAMFHSGWFLYLGMQGIVRERGFQVLKDAGDIGGAYASSFGVDEASTVRQALRFVDERRGQPFFLMYLPIAGHHPYAAPGPADRPRPFQGQGDLSRYQNDLHAGDAALATLVHEIDRRGLAQQTLWVISGDHGEAFFQHEGNLAHTLHIYEENVHVPLLLLAPGVLERPQRASRVASLLDIAPTILELVGVKAPPGYQGRSLLTEDGGGGAARFFVDQALWQVGLRHGDLKFIHEMEGGRSRLFDLRQDPGERVDLSAAQPGRVAGYREHLRAWAGRQQAWVAGAGVTVLRK